MDNSSSSFCFSFSQPQVKLDPEYGCPCERSSHGVSLVGNSLIVIGGESIPRTPFPPNQFTWIIDNLYENPTWRLIPPPSSSSSSCSFPPTRVGHSQAVVGEKVFIFGGRAGITMEEKAMNDLWVLDLSKEKGEEKWERIEEGGEKEGCPCPRSFHQMTSFKEKIYVFGGCGKEGRLSDMWEYDLKKGGWKGWGEGLLKGRGGACLVTLKNGLGVVGGFAGEETNDGQLFWVGEGEREGEREEGWAKEKIEGLEEMRPRSVCVGGEMGGMGMAIIFGGEVNASAKGHEGAGGFENDIIILDGEKGGMVGRVGEREGEEWPEKRGWGAGAFEKGEGGEREKGRFFLFGGLCGDDENPRRLGDLWMGECVRK